MCSFRTWRVYPNTTAPRLFFTIRSKAMHAAKPSPINDHVVAYLVADDPPASDWLEDNGVVAIDENGVWRLTALGEVAMARFNGRHRAELALCL
jgi:hypothetical protein